jgi:hypothetical protein
VTLAVAAVLLLCVWTVSELRTKTPLIDVRGGYGTRRFYEISRTRQCLQRVRIG